MGMDFLDITYRVEQRVGVSLSQEDVSEILHDNDISVGDLYDLILKKLHLRDVARYDIRLNYDLWLEMQRALHSVTHVPLERIELKTRLETLFPKPTRRAAWNALRDTCPYRIRELDYPQIVRVAGLLLAAAMVLLEQFQLWQMPGVKWLWPLLGLLGVWLFVETYWKVLAICSPFRNSFSSEMMTVKDLCRQILAANYVDICRNVEIPLDARCLRVWEQLSAILAEALDVELEQITFRSRLVRDLGMA